MVDGSVPGGEAGWEPLLDDLEDRRRAARAMGGPEKLARRRDEGGLDARARIAHLLDPGSFVEIGTLVGSVPADGLVAGSGTIQGRHVMVGAEDFTVLGGSIGAGSSAKRFRISELAELDRIPLVMLLEGAGHRPPLPDEPAPGRAPTDLIQQARLSGRVPLVTGVLGASAGHGALVAPISDFSVMTLDASIFAAGPPVVKASLGEDVSKQDLGGPGVAVASGLGAGTAAIALGVVAVFAGPAVLVLVPLLTGAGVATWWVTRRDVPPAL